MGFLDPKPLTPGALDAVAAGLVANPASDLAGELSATIDDQIETSPAIPEKIDAAAGRPAPARLPRPLIVFTFDDGPGNDRTYVQPMLATKGIRATFGIISQTVGTGGALTWAQVKDIQDDGHEIANHSATHVSLNTTDAALLDTEVTQSHAAFVANGIRPTGFIWPFASSSVTSRAAVSRLYRWALGGVGGTTQPLHTYAIERFSIGNSTLLADHQAQIDAAIASNQLLIYLIHSGTMDANGRTTLEAVIDYAKTKSAVAPIVTASEALHLVGNTFDSGDYPSRLNYTVVDGAGRFYSNNVTPIAVYAALNSATAATTPETFATGKVTYTAISSPGNTDWPVAGAGNVVTNRAEGSNAVYTYQQFIQGNVIYTRRAATATTWGTWSTPPAAAITEVKTIDTVTAATTPGSYTAGKITYAATSGTFNTDWPVTGTNGLIEVNRLYTSSPSYIWQSFTTSTGVLYNRRAVDANTWTAWIKAGPA